MGNALTPRERQAWEALAQDAQVRDVAERLGISRARLSQIQESLLRKLGCATRAGLTAKWHRENRPTTTPTDDSYFDDADMGV